MFQMLPAVPKSSGGQIFTQPRGHHIGLPMNGGDKPDFKIAPDIGVTISIIASMKTNRIVIQSLLREGGGAVLAHCLVDVLTDFPGHGLGSFRIRKCIVPAMFYVIPLNCGPKCQVAK